MLKTIAYKAYVIALLVFVVWVAQFIYPLIYWEFEYTGVTKKIDIKKNDSDLLKMRKIRDYMDHNVQVRSHDLGDVLVEEHFEYGHFHHVGQTLTEPVLNGCDYCHTVMPHMIDEEARAFRNMHGYFVACETCHYFEDTKPDKIEHHWVKVKTEEKIVRPLALIQQRLANKKGLAKAKGNYGARITPWIKQNGKIYSIVGKSSKGEAQSMLEGFEAFSQSQVKSILQRMHKGLTKKPLKCDACHTHKKTALSYEELGYTKEDINKLMDTEVASVISEYDKFHFPNLFIRKDDRNRDKFLGQ